MLIIHPPRRGRPTKEEALRNSRIRAVAQLLAGTLRGDEAAAAFGVSRSTVYRWRNELLADDKVDTDFLRRLSKHIA